MKTRNILLINVNWLGDVLFSTPAIRALKRSAPYAGISVLIHPRCKDVLAGNPLIDELIAYDEEGEHKGLMGKLRLILYLRKKGFERTYILHRSLTRALIACLSGIPMRVGYYYRKRAVLLTDNIRPSPNDVHRVDFYLGVLEQSGIDIKEEDRKIEFFITDEDRAKIREILKKEGVDAGEKFIVLNPGANWTPKRWPAENFANLADILLEKHSKKVIITGSSSDARLADDIVRLIKNKPVILTGKLSLKELGALFEMATLVISADSGPLHIALAVGSRAIGLYGPTSTKITGPYRNKDAVIIQKMVGCIIPCYKVDCIDTRCMSAITVSDVLKEIGKNII
jgi:lipopolysaccharide heptosyltransferase II